LNVLLRRLGFHLPISLFFVRRRASEHWEGHWRKRLAIGLYNTALGRGFQLPRQLNSQFAAVPGTTQTPPF